MFLHDRKKPYQCEKLAVTDPSELGFHYAHDGGDMSNKELFQCLLGTLLRQGEAHPLTSSPPSISGVTTFVCEYLQALI